MSFQWASRSKVSTPSVSESEPATPSTEWSASPGESSIPGHSLERVGPTAPRRLGRAGGRPLPEPVRRKMEGAFGSDFSSIRVHEVGESASQGAEAFTRGEDVTFAPGRYRPESQKGQELLGHELSHVVQQRAGRVTSAGLLHHAQGLEAEAESHGARAARGQSVSVPGAFAAAMAPVPVGGAGAVQFAGSWYFDSSTNRKIQLRQVPGSPGTFQMGNGGPQYKSTGVLHVDGKTQVVAPVGGGGVGGGGGPLAAVPTLQSYIQAHLKEEFGSTVFKSAKRKAYDPLLRGRVHELAVKHKRKKKFKAANPANKTQGGYLDTNRYGSNFAGVDSIEPDHFGQHKAPAVIGTAANMARKMGGYVRKRPHDAVSFAKAMRGGPKKTKNPDFTLWRKLQAANAGTKGAPRKTAKAPAARHDKRFQNIFPPTLNALSATPTQKELEAVIQDNLHYYVPKDLKQPTRDYLDNSQNPTFTSTTGVVQNHSSFVKGGPLTAQEIADMADDYLDNQHGNWV